MSRFALPVPAREKAIDLGLFLLRLTFGGLMFINHGWGKLLKLFGDEPIKFADPFGLGMTASLGLAVFAEVICALLLIIGLFTRWATIPLIITMLIAIFVVHISDPFMRMEKAILFLVPYLIIYLTGPGKFSVDHMLGREE